MRLRRHSSLLLVTSSAVSRSNPATGDCLVTFSNSVLGSAIDNTLFDVGADKFMATFGGLRHPYTIFQGIWTIATKVGELDLANAVQTSFGGTQGKQCQVTLEADGLMWLSSDFDPDSSQVAGWRMYLQPGTSFSSVSSTARMFWEASLVSNTSAYTFYVEDCNKHVWLRDLYTICNPSKLFENARHSFSRMCAMHSKGPENRSMSSPRVFQRTQPFRLIVKNALLWSDSKS
jgi:hypothetical protein